MKMRNGNGGLTDVQKKEKKIKYQIAWNRSMKR
jgi:hypothetical protein